MDTHGHARTHTFVYINTALFLLCFPFERMILLTKLVSTFFRWVKTIPIRETPAPQILHATVHVEPLPPDGRRVSRVLRGSHLDHECAPAVRSRGVPAVHAQAPQAHVRHLSGRLERVPAGDERNPYCARLLGRHAALATPAAIDTSTAHTAQLHPAHPPPTARGAP